MSYLCKCSSEVSSLPPPPQFAQVTDEISLVFFVGLGIALLVRDFSNNRFTGLNLSIVSSTGIGWRRPIGCLIYIGHFPQRAL